MVLFAPFRELRMLWVKSVTELVHILVVIGQVDIQNLKNGIESMFRNLKSLSC